jgi:hypothetical protein
MQRFGISAAITLVTDRPVFRFGFRQVLFELAAAAITFPNPFSWRQTTAPSTWLE